MNTQEEYKEDLLSQYLNPKMIEKAPEGFTSKVMTHIQIDGIPLKPAGMFRNRSLVPLISAAVTILLILAAFLIPGNETDSLAIPLVKLVKDIKISLPVFDLTSVFRFNPPALLIYVFIGILILSVFDRALNLLFHREK